MRTRFWVNRPASPERSVGIRTRSRCTSGSSPLRLAVALPRHEGPQQERAEPDHEQGEREAERLHRRVLGLHPAPRRRLQDAQHDEAEPARREDGADAVEVRPRALRRGVPDEAAHRQDDQDEHDLPDEHDPPGQLGRRPAAEDGTDGDAGAGHAADDGVGDLALAALEVAGDERRERGQHERRTETLEDRPPEGEDGDGLRDRGDRRADGVDHEPDDERPAPTDDVADLGAGQHEHRHHQAVQGDDRLDRRDRGVELLDERADRDVHDRLVEHHHELRDRQGDQRGPSLHRTSSPDRVGARPPPILAATGRTTRTRTGMCARLSRDRDVRPARRVRSVPARLGAPEDWITQRDTASPVRARHAPRSAAPGTAQEGPS